ncbi:MAG: hypothetical protein U9R05_05825 [Chloroflexota bacterium]|nr:hypothetical protein [Chloroflexota bacterium]
MSNSMVDSARNHDFDPNRRTSFVVRCWIDAEGEVHTRLIDVHSGVSYPLARQSDLPELIRRLLLRRSEAPDVSAQ